VLSTKSITGDGFQGDFSTDFTTEMVAGREVSGDFATDAHLTVPDMSIVVDKPNGAGDQLLHVRCLPDRKVLVDLDPGVNAIVTTDHQGRATLNLSDVVEDGFVLTTEQIKLSCQSANGDTVLRVLQP